MKRLLLPFGLLMLVLVAVGLLRIANTSTTALNTNTAQSWSGADQQSMVSATDMTGLNSAVDSADGDMDVEATMPPALRKHYEQLMAATPGGGREGPVGTAADWRFMSRAYPDHDISIDKIEGARAAHAQHVADAIAERAALGAAASSGQTWVSVGPTRALYPRFRFRDFTGYVPNAYEAGGRTTSMAIAPVCVPRNCRLWITAAGGGVWRTDDALRTDPVWTYLSGSFGINSASSIALDPNDSNTVWVGTGEANASADSEAGVGLYKSTDGGDTWTGPIGKGSFNARAIGSIAIDPTNSNTMYVATTRGVRGVSSVISGGAVSLAPGAPPFGLYRTMDGGVTFELVFNGAALTTGCRNPTNVARNLTPCSPRGVRRVVIDPSNHNMVYASAYARGVWRSANGGSTWQQIFLPIADGAGTSFTERAEIAVTKLANGNTRMYLGIGQIQAPPAALYRSDSVSSGGTPSFTLLTSSDPANPGYGTFNYCEGQCWYDNFVYTPAGNPDTVYVGGSYAYGETGNISNGRGVVLSTDAGMTFTDVTMDATDAVHPNGIHPDQHFLVTNPSNPLQFIESGDGGVIRASGQYADISANCVTRGLSGAVLARCQQLLSRVPTVLHGLNRGVSSLQFQSLSVSPFDATVLQGGTQDNGTWQSTTTPGLFLQTRAGDGGQSGFDIGNPKFRFHTFFAPQVEVNFLSGGLTDWNWIADPIVNTASQFYIPIISDPVVSRTMYAGTDTVYRTQTDGMGTMPLTTFRKQCNNFTGLFQVTCGDWVPLGATKLTAIAGGTMAAVQRASSDTSTLWAATTSGGVFISQNADTNPEGSVTFTRIDTTSTVAPNRFISGIAVDTANANHAWISYSGYSATTPSTPGHVFEVTYNPTTQTATFVDWSHNLRDLPITGIVFDNVTGDLYASSDFGVYRLRSGGSIWGLAGKGMPNVEVAGLTIVPSARVLYAATHGLGAWALQLK